jgi:hypothetical protein
MRILPMLPMQSSSEPLSSPPITPNVTGDDPRSSSIRPVAPPPSIRQPSTLHWRARRGGFALRWSAVARDGVYVLGGLWLGVSAALLAWRTWTTAAPRNTFLLIALAGVALLSLSRTMRPFLNRSSFTFDDQRLTCRTSPLPLGPAVSVRLATITAFAWRPESRWLSGALPPRLALVAETRTGAVQPLGVVFDDERHALFVIQELSRVLLAQRQPDVGGPFRASSPADAA